MHLRLVEGGTIGTVYDNDVRVGSPFYIYVSKRGLKSFEEREKAGRHLPV